MKKESRYNKEFKLVKNTLENNFKSVQIPDISTEEQYMSVSAAIHGKFTKCDKNLGIGLITVFVDTLSQLLMIKDDNQFVEIMHKVLANSKVVKEKIGSINKMTGNGKYVPIQKHSGKLHGKEFDLVVVSIDIETSILEQLKHIDIHDANNLRALARDLNDCGKMYQELTLDDDKKLYTVVASFYQEFVRAESTIHLDHTPVNFRKIIESTNRNGDIAEPFTVFRKGYKDIDMETEVGDYNAITSARGTKKIILKDHLAEIQNRNIAAIEKVVNVTGVKGYQQTKLSEETIKDLDILGNNKELAKDLVELIVNPYHFAIKVKAERMAKLGYRKLSKNAQEELRLSLIRKIDQDNSLTPAAKASKKAAELADFDKHIKLTKFEADVYATRWEEKFKETVDELSNLARFFTKDLSIVQAGRALFTASHITVNGAENSVSMRDIPSKAYLNIAPELAFAYITATQGDMKVCGYPLRGKTELVNEGDVLEFACGSSTNVEGVYIDNAYTGTLKVQTVNDVVSAVVDIAELLEANRIQPVTPKRIYLKLLNSKTYDMNTFLTEKTVKRLGSFYDFDRQGGFNRANELTLQPKFRSKNKNNRYNRIEFNVIVGNVTSLDDPSTIVQVPFCGYSSYSAQLENILAGLTVKSITKVQLTEKSALGVIQFGDEPTYVEVEKIHFENMVDDIFGPVPDVNQDTSAFSQNTSMEYVNNEDLDEFEQQMREMGLTMQDFDGFGDIATITNTVTAPVAFAPTPVTDTNTTTSVAFAPAADTNTTTIEETPIVEKSNEPQSEFDDEINSALQRLGIDLKDLSDFYAFK